MLFPENVRHEAMQDQEDKQPLDATAEQGHLLVEAAVSKTVEFLEEMIAGEHRGIQRHVLSSEIPQKR